MLVGKVGELVEAPAGKLAVEGVDYGADGKFAVSGKAEPGATVQVYLDNEFLGSATADART